MLLVVEKRNKRSVVFRLLQRIKEGRRDRLMDKWLEALKSVTPIVAIVLFLCFFIVPVPTDALTGFLFGSGLLVIGMGLFNLGTEMAMTPIGEGIGTAITQSRKKQIVLIVGFLVGLFATIAEPDLSVFATQVPSIPKWIMIICIALGVGFFLSMSLMRILYGIQMKIILLISYGVLLILALFVPRSFLAVAFDAGGVTTGPMTVPFIMGLGVGVAASRTDKGAESDSFGLIALSSVGPILAVMLLGVVFTPKSGEATSIVMTEAENSMLLFRAFSQETPEYIREVGLSMAPVLVFFLIFQQISLHIRGSSLIRIVNGLINTYVGLVIFLLGVNVGFMPVGHFIGLTIGAMPFKWILIPLGMLIGWFLVAAEPAVQVLNSQVYEMTAGLISTRAMGISMSVGVSLSVGLSLFRVLTGLPMLFFVLPGYCLALVLMFFTPPTFTAIAFDSGGVASGPMTTTFLLPLAMGTCQAVGGNLAADAFGLVGMVAMTPLITIQLLGIVYKVNESKSKKQLEAIHEEIIEL